MGWYERALEYEQEFLNRPKNDFNFSLGEIKYAYFEDGIRIKEISIPSRYEGEMPDLGLYPELEILNIYIDTTWEYITSFDFRKLKKLYANLRKDSKEIPLNIATLEELHLYINDGYSSLTPLEKMLMETREYDFSLVPNLEKLVIKNWNTLDYSSLSSLNRLKYLMISDSHSKDLKWVRNLPMLEEFHCYAKIENVEGIEIQQNLKKLSLSHNEITEASPILELNHLQYLDLRRNPIANADSLREKGISTLLITQKDYDLKRIEEIVDNFFRDPLLRVHSENKRFKENPDGCPDYLKKKISLPLQERLKPYIQDEFERSLKGIAPFGSFNFEYSMEYKSKYIKYALEQYPFLKFTKEMAKQVVDEGNQAICFEPCVPGIIKYLGEDIYLIKAEVVPGRGEVHINPGRRIQYKPIIRKCIESFWNDFLPKYDIAAYDINIDVKAIYGTDYVTEDMVMAILIAISSAINKQVFPEKTVLFAKYTASGNLSKDNLYDKQRRIAAMNGFQTIITYGNDLLQMPQKDDYCGYLYYNNIKDLLRHCLRDPEPPVLKPRNRLEQTILDIFNSYPQAIREANIFKALTKDLLFDFKREVYVLNLLAETNILSDIESAAFVDAKLAYRYEYKICEDFGIDQALAHQIVRSLGYCFGGCYLNKNLQDWT